MEKIENDFIASLSREFDNLKGDNSKQQSEIVKLERLTAGLRKAQEYLGASIISLHSRVKAEIEKKDRTIFELRRELDDLKCGKRKAESDHENDQRKRMKYGDSSEKRHADYTRNTEYHKRSSHRGRSGRSISGDRWHFEKNNHNRYLDHRENPRYNCLNEEHKTSLKADNSSECTDDCYVKHQENEKPAKVEDRHVVVTESYGGFDVPTGRTVSRKLSKPPPRLGARQSPTQNSFTGLLKKKLKVVTKLEKDYDEKRSKEGRDKYRNNRSERNLSEKISESHSRKLKYNMAMEPKLSRTEQEPKTSEKQSLCRHDSLEEGQILSDDEVLTQKYRHGMSFDDAKPMKRSRSKSCHEMKPSSLEEESNQGNDNKSECDGKETKPLRRNCTKSISLEEYKRRETSMEIEKTDKETEATENEPEKEHNTQEKDTDLAKTNKGQLLDLKHCKECCVGSPSEDISKCSNLADSVNTKLEELFGKETPQKITQNNVGMNLEQHQRRTNVCEHMDTNDPMSILNDSCKENKIIVLSDVTITPSKPKSQPKHSILENPLTVLADTAIEQSRRSMEDNNTKIEKDAASTEGHDRGLIDLEVTNSPQSNLDVSLGIDGKPIRRSTRLRKEVERLDLSTERITSRRKSKDDRSTVIEIITLQHTTEVKEVQLDVGADRTNSKMKNSGGKKEPSNNARESPNPKRRNSESKTDSLRATNARPNSERRNSENKTELSATELTKPAGFSTPQHTSEVKERRRITPIPVKEKSVCTFANILEKTGASTFTVQNTFHLTHDGEIPEIHIEENLSMLNDSKTADNTIMKLLDTMNISNTGSESGRFREGEGVRQSGQLSFMNLVHKVESANGHNQKEDVENPNEARNLKDVDEAAKNDVAIDGTTDVSANTNTSRNTQLSFENCIKKGTSTPIIHRQNGENEETTSQTLNKNIVHENATTTSKQSQIEEEKVSVQANNVSTEDANANLSTGSNTSAQRRRRPKRRYLVVDVD